MSAMRAWAELEALQLTSMPEGIHTAVIIHALTTIHCHMILNPAPVTMFPPNAIIQQYTCSDSS